MFCIRAKCPYKEYTKKTVSKIEFSNKILFLKATKYSFKNLFSKTKFFEMFSKLSNRTEDLIFQNSTGINIVCSFLPKINVNTYREEEEDRKFCACFISLRLCIMECCIQFLISIWSACPNIILYAFMNIIFTKRLDNIELCIFILSLEIL